MTRFEGEWVVLRELAYDEKAQRPSLVEVLARGKDQADACRALNSHPSWTSDDTAKYHFHVPTMQLTLSYPKQP